MKNTPKHRIPLLPLFAAGLFAAQANAAIIIKFEEIGGNVVATSTGSMVVPNTFGGNLTGSGLVVSIDDRLLYWPGGTARYFNGGINPGFTLNALHGEPLGSAGAAGNTFGIEGSNIYFGSSAVAGEVYTPTTTWTWVSADMDAIGQGALTSTPMTIYTASNGETVSFALVPEPSSAILFGCGLMVICRRKRK